MKTKGSDKLLVVLGFAISALVILGLVFMAAAGGIDSFMLLEMFLVMVLVIGATWVMIKKMKNVKAGLPVKDELEKKVSWRSGAYSYCFTLFLAVFILWYNGLIGDIFGLPALTVEQTVAVIVLLPGIIFVGLYFYFNRKGNV